MQILLNTNEDINLIAILKFQKIDAGEAEEL